MVWVVLVVSHSSNAGLDVLSLEQILRRLSVHSHETVSCLSCVRIVLVGSIEGVVLVGVETVSTHVFKFVFC